MCTKLKSLHMSIEGARHACEPIPEVWNLVGVASDRQAPTAINAPFSVFGQDGENIKDARVVARIRLPTIAKGYVSGCLRN
jgi:hypothetical protein